MKTIRSTTIINASPEQVWNVLMDFEAYPQWNPFIQSIKGKAVMGASLEVEIHPEGQKPMLFKPEVVNFEENRHFAWLGKLFMKGLFDGEHHFRLSQEEDGTTLLVHEEHFSGLLVRPLLTLVEKSTLAGFQAMNKALADRVAIINQKTSRHEIQS